MRVGIGQWRNCHRIFWSRGHRQQLLFGLWPVSRANLVAGDVMNYAIINGGRVQGIKLTEKVLSGAGFLYHGKISATISKWIMEDSNFLLYFNGIQAGLITSLPKSVPFIYLHQLQNLYFSITGIELQFKNGINYNNFL